MLGKLLAAHAGNKMQENDDHKNDRDDLEEDDQDNHDQSDDHRDDRDDLEDDHWHGDDLRDNHDDLQDHHDHNLEDDQWHGDDHLDIYVALNVSKAVFWQPQGGSFQSLLCEAQG